MGLELDFCQPVVDPRWHCDSTSKAKFVAESYLLNLKKTFYFEIGVDSQEVTERVQLGLMPPPPIVVS